MTEDIIATMEAEEAELSRKLDAVRQFLAVYRGRAGASRPQRPSGGGEDNGKSRVQRSQEQRMDKFGPYGQRIVDFANRILPGCDSNPVPTRDLVRYMEESGITITGANKVNSLSAILARSTKMKGWSRAGWTRAVTEDGELLRRHKAQSGHNENGATEAAPDAEEAATSSKQELSG